MKHMSSTIITTVLAGMLLVLALDGPADATRRSHQSSTQTNNDRGTVDESSQERKVRDLPGGMRYRIRVDDFVDESSYDYSWYQGSGHVTRAWSRLLAQAFIDDGSCRIITNDNRNASKTEQEFQSSGATKHTKTVAKKGYMAGAQFGVRVTLTSIKKTGQMGGSLGRLVPGILGASIKRGGYKVAMEVEVYDLQTGITITMKRVEGSSHSFGLGLPSLPGGASFGFEKEPDLEKAAADVLHQAVELCVDQFGTVQWIARVVRVNKSKVYVNVGKRDNVTVGQLFTAGEAFTIDDPETGEFLDYDLTPAGSLKVVKVLDKMSICKIVQADEEETIDKTMSIWIPEN